MFNGEIVLFIREKYKERGIELAEGIGLMNIVLEDILSELTGDINKLMMDNKYDIAQTYMKAHESVNGYIARNHDLIGLLEPQDDDIIQDEDIEDERMRGQPDYERYAVNRNIPRSLYESFKHKRPHAFEIKDYKQEAFTWKEVFLKTSKFLYQQNPNIMNQFPDDKHMNGRTRAHFSFIKDNLREPIKIEGSNIYLETNQSADSIRQIIIKMLRKYDIKTSDFIVYFRADYSELHE